MTQKIFFATPWYASCAGGYEHETRRLAEFLVTLGHDIEILTTCRKDPYTSWEKDHFKPGVENINGVTVRRFKTNKGELQKHLDALINYDDSNEQTKKQYDFFRHGISSDDLIDYVATIPVEIPIVTGPYFHSLCFNLTTAHPNRIHLRPAFHDEPQMHWQPVKDMIASAKDFLFFSEEEKDLAIKAAGKEGGRNLVESHVVGCPVDEHDQTLANETPKPKILPDDYFIYVGRKEVGKNVNLLIDRYLAYASEKQNIPPLVFVGGGEKQLIPNENPLFIDLGYLSEEEKQASIKDAIALINLSENESFSYVIMEAWLNKTPVIVSEYCPATRAHAIRSNGGCIVFNERSFIEALDKLREPELNAKYAENGLNYVRTNYLIKHVANQFVKALSLNTPNDKQVNNQYLLGIIDANHSDTIMRASEILLKKGLPCQIVLINDDEDLSQKIDACDIVVSLTNQDTKDILKPIKHVLELEKPCIVSDHPQFTKLPEDACVKISTDEYEAEELAEMVAFLLKNAELRKQLGKNAKAYGTKFNN